VRRDPYAEPGRAASGRAVGLGVAVGLHLLAGWALVTGLVRKDAQPESRTVEARILAEPRVPPPPPPPAPPAQPPPPARVAAAPAAAIATPAVVAPAPMPVVPPAAVPVPAAPAAPAAVVAAAPAAPPVVAASPPAAPAVAAAPAAPAAAPPAPARPALRRGVRPLRQVRPAYPAQALQDEIEGEVLARATVGRDGRVHSVSIVSARPRGVFERAVEAALRQYEFPPDDQEYVVEVPFSFRLE
jgi:protein TonB